MAYVLPLVSGLLVFAGVEASDVAERSMHQGFLSEYIGSDASKTSLGDYNKFAMPGFNQMTHEVPAQDSMAFGHERFEPPEIVDKKKSKAAQKLHANETPVADSPSGMLLSLACSFCA